MFDFLKKHKQQNPASLSDSIKAAGLSRDEAARMLGTDPALLAEFEQAYTRHMATSGVSDNLFKISAKEMKDMVGGGKESVNKELRDRIVNELLEQTEVLYFNGQEFTIERFADTKADSDCALATVTSEEVRQMPEPLRPQFTGHLMCRDMGDEPSYPALLATYRRYLEETDPKKKKMFYGQFRQGLDILDLDAVTYEIIGTNPNSIGNWLPQIGIAAVKEGFFKIPKTRVVKVPLSLLQMTRKEYATLTAATLDIVDEWARKAFDLKPDGDYFIKTGTYSSKFDFRNAHVTTSQEIADLGQYLLFIHYQALCYAHYDLSGRNQPVIYGMSTTNEWAVREFIPSASNAAIYHGMPLRTEYRIFVDFDTRQVIGKSPYWEPQTMKHRFEQMSDAQEADQLHDSIIYRMAEPQLMETYHSNVEEVCRHVQGLLPDAADAGLTGQWSIDIMQEEDDFYLIDMAVAETSAFYDCVPNKLRMPRTENWLPDASVIGVAD